MKPAGPILALAAVLLGGCDDPAPYVVPVLSAPRGGQRIFLSTQDRRTLPPSLRSISVRSLLRVTRPMHYGAYLWNEAGARSGEVRISIDLRRQLLSVFRGGDEVGTAVILYGADGRPTPRGLFPILARLRDHQSSLYDAPMPYTLRLTGDGVAIHGSNVRRGAATHGCIGIPTDFARQLYAIVKRGDPVLIT